MSERSRFPGEHAAAPRAFLRLAAAFLRTRCAAMVLYLVPPALFTALNALGGGALRETGYAWLLTGAVGCAALIVGFRRFAARQTRLWEAQTRPPEDAAALPKARGASEAAWRAIAAGTIRRSARAAADAAAAAKDRADYYTLWMHQIKTPIAVLDLMAQSDEPCDKALLRQEAFKLSQYADAALSYERLSSISSDLDFSPVALFPLCAAAVRRLRPMFQYRRVGLEMPSFSGDALTDAKWLLFVLTQVLTNALKYTPPGGRITVTQPLPGVLEIADTGIGIPAEDVPRVFERGFTGRAGRRQEKSTGIGLYLCREVMRRLGHRISLASKLGEGTRVTLDLRRDTFGVD